MTQNPDTLFFQTALSTTFVALLSGSVGIDQIETYLDFKSDNVYVQDSRTLLARNLIKPTDMSRVFVLVGPGYFTGIRAGLVIAKAFQDSLSVEVGLIDSFDYLRACQEDPGDCAIVIAASRKEGYIAYFSGRQKIKEEMIPLTQIQALQKETKLYSETTFIQEIYSALPIVAKPLIPQTYKLVKNSVDIVPHYIRTESDLFRTTL